MTSPSSEALRQFQSLCAELSAPELAELRDKVAAHAQHLVREQARSELIAADLALAVRDRLERLFELAPELSAEALAQVVGAARYFTSKDDAIPDTQACTGLDDDVAVVNHVLGALGRQKWRIEE